MTEKRKRPRRISAKMRKKFLEHLAEGATVKDAAKGVGMLRRSFYKLRDKDETFAKEWEKAQRVGDGAILDEIKRRGLHGYAEPHFYQGKITAYVTKYSDYLLDRLASARIPGWKSDSVVSVSVGVNQSDRPITDPRERAKWLAFLLRRGDPGLRELTGIDGNVKPPALPPPECEPVEDSQIPRPQEREAVPVHQAESTRVEEVESVWFRNRHEQGW